MKKISFLFCIKKLAILGYVNYNYKKREILTKGYKIRYNER